MEGLCGKSTLNPAAPCLRDAGHNGHCVGSVEDLIIELEAEKAAHAAHHSEESGPLRGDDAERVALDFGSTRFNHTSGNREYINQVCKELAALIRAERAKSAAAERARIVAWLRDKAFARQHDMTYGPMADDIESGDHIPKPEELK